MSRYRFHPRLPLATCVLLTANVGCSDPSADTSVDPLVQDSAGVRVVVNREATWEQPWQVAEVPLITIGGEKDDAGVTLHQVTGALRLSNGNVVVANGGTYELLFFTNGGEFLRRSGGNGGGPGEFLSLEKIARSGTDTILAVDVRSQRVSYFDSSGVYGRSVRLQPNTEIPVPRVLGVFSDGSLLATRGLFLLGGRPPTRVERDEQRLFRYEWDGQTVYDLGAFPGIERDVMETGRVTPSGAPDVQRWPRRFGRNTAYETCRDQFFVADNATYQIDVRSSDGTLTHIIRKIQPPQAVTEQDLSALRDSTTDPLMLRTWDRRPAPAETMPAFAPELHADINCELWVREYSLPGDSDASYSVFDSTGIFLGKITLPGTLAILDIGNDYVLLLQRDELDVEYVRLYELRKAG